MVWISHNTDAALGPLSLDFAAGSRQHAAWGLSMDIITLPPAVAAFCLLGIADDVKTQAGGSLPSSEIVR